MGTLVRRQYGWLVVLLHFDSNCLSCFNLVVSIKWDNICAYNSRYIEVVGTVLLYDTFNIISF